MECNMPASQAVPGSPEVVNSKQRCWTSLSGISVNTQLAPEVGWKEVSPQNISADYSDPVQSCGVTRWRTTVVSVVRSKYTGSG